MLLSQSMSVLLCMWGQDPAAVKTSSHSRDELLRDNPLLPSHMYKFVCEVHKTEVGVQKGASLLVLSCM